MQRESLFVAELFSLSNYILQPKNTYAVLNLQANKNAKAADKLWVSSANNALRLR